MRLGIGMAYWGLGFTKDDQRALAVAAEELGFDSLWVAEGYGSDAVSVLSWLAAATTRIGLGTAVMQIPGRPPTMTAMSAATLDALSDGRFQLGLGLSGPQVSEGWYGVEYAKPLLRTREYVEIVRMALARERVIYAGESVRLPLPGGPGKSLKLTISPVQPQIPILLAAMGPANVELTGSIADGWIPMFFAPEYVDLVREPLDRGSKNAGRTPDDVAICPQVWTCVDDDADAARDAMRPMVSMYLGGMGPRENNFYAKLVTRYGFGAAVQRIQELYLGGRKDEAAAAVPADLIDLVCVCGPAERMRTRLRTYADAGVDTFIAVPVATESTDLTEQVHRIGAAARDHLNIPAVNRK